MQPKKRVPDTASVSILDIVVFRYLPYWPLFLILSFLFSLVALVYMRYQAPLYDISATLVISDQAKGAGETESVRSLNIYAANKIVENEVQILQSRSLLDDVVQQLFLYAPLYERGKLKPAQAYTTSPVVVEAKQPGLLKETREVAFSYEPSDSSVVIGGKHYAINQWISFPFGVIRFLSNPHIVYYSVRPLYFSIIDPKEAATAIGTKLDISAGSKLSTVITLKYKDEIARRGEDILNTLLMAYNRRSILNNNQLAANTLAFIDDRLHNVEKEIDSIERRIQQFKSTQGIVDLSEQSKIYLQNVSENSQKTADINMQLAVLDQIERHVQQQDLRTGIIPTNLGINDPVLADLLQKLNDLELQYSNTRTTTGENHPLTKSIESELVKIRPRILNLVRDQRLRLTAGRDNLTNTSSQVNAQIRSIPAKERALLEISRQQGIKNNIYALLLQRREEAALSKASTISDSRIVDFAQASAHPTNSKKYMALLGAIIAALIVSILYIFIREGMSSKVLFRSELEKQTHIPVLGEVPLQKKKEAGLINGPLLSSLQQMQSTLGLFQVPPAAQCVLFTSGRSGEGKTYVSRQFAKSLTLTGKKVLLADFNFYTSETSKYYGLQDKKGITHFINGKADLREVIHSVHDGIHMLPIGSGIHNPMELLLSDKINTLLAHLKENYDYILIDAPPVETTSDPFVLVPYADIVLLIVRYGKTSKLTLRQLEDDIRIRKLEQKYIVFNGIKARGFLRRYYGYGFGYGNDPFLINRNYMSASV